MTTYMIIAGIIGLWMLVGRPAFALSADRDVPRYTDQEILTFPVAAGVRIYKDAFVGTNLGGYLKPFEPGDVFQGLAKHSKDNTAGSDGTINCDVRTNGDFEITLSGLAQTDVNRPIFAVDDGAAGLTGHPDGYMGRLIAVTSATQGRVRMRAPGDIPTSGCILIDIDFGKITHAPVLTAGNEQYIGGILRYDAIGAGIVAVGISPDEANGEVRLLLDNDNEAQNLTIQTPQVFNITKGITATFTGRLKVAGGAATDDLDFGLAGGMTLTDTERANLDATTSGLKSCKFHLDCNSNDIFVSSDDDASPVPAVDTTVDNSLTVNKEHTIVARPGGACQAWIDKARKLTSTAFSVSATGLFCGIINLEKSTGTGVPEARFSRMRIAGAA